MSNEQKKAVETFITHVKTGDWASLSETIVYPVKRAYPIPSIENKEDFIERWSELFDDKMINLISNSVPDLSLIHI